jgi:hypothetical protein
MKFMNETEHGAPDPRCLERLLLDYFRSLRVYIDDIAGEPHIDIVRCYEADGAIATELSLERLAKFLSRELAL